MEQILGAFGIDWRLLLVDMINFGILLFLLWKFLYRPLTSMIEKRQQMVAQGVLDASAAKERLSEIESSRAQTMAQAGKEADEVLSLARKAASKKEHELVAQGEAAAARIVAEAEGRAREEKEQAILQSKQEVAKLIILGIEKAIIKS